MAHLAEHSQHLRVRVVPIHSADQLLEQARGVADVCIVRLPASGDSEHGLPLQGIERLVEGIARALGPQATLITIGEPSDLVRVHAALSSYLRYQLWIAIKRATIRPSKALGILPQHHFGALVHTKYTTALRHAKTRIQYTYCPLCNKTTKDYGGKKHTYHEFGTLMSDVWRDIACDLESDLTPVMSRFAELFGIAPYQELRVLDCRGILPHRVSASGTSSGADRGGHQFPRKLTNTLMQEDCLGGLKRIPDNSVDFVFADPPYNLRKKYLGYADGLDITEYFTWCDKWIEELARVLMPGRTCAILNIPLWAIRHFLYLEKILRFQNWIVWDALSFPVRFIMPAHYAALCFSKGAPRPLPGLTAQANQGNGVSPSNGFHPLQPSAEGYCLRSNCVATRNALRLNEQGPLTDLWWDIHRLKHNSRRVDHPCQLPPQLMYRLISLFTKPGEIILDCFNGAGTTTLAAHQLHRTYIGMERSEQYHRLARARHEEIGSGLDPFRKEERTLTAKNSPVPRLPKQKYLVPKKTLQLDVKRVAQLLGRMPSREDIAKHGRHPIGYYDKYFISWGEVCAAARTTGMSEDRVPVSSGPTDRQLELFAMERRAVYRARFRSIQKPGCPQAGRAEERKATREDLRRAGGRRSGGRGRRGA